MDTQKNAFIVRLVKLLRRLVETRMNHICVS